MATAEDEITLHEMVEVIVTILNARDPYTYEHSWRVAALCEQIAKEMNVPQKWIDTLHIAAHLHDIGKVGIPDFILNKPGKLLPYEYELIKAHSIIGYQIVHKIPILQEIALYIRHHHERWDGKGYPDGLAGKEIPLGARIIAVADTFDAITTHRPYRSPRSLGEAFTEIKAAAGSQLCPETCEVFIGMEKKITQLLGIVEQELKETGRSLKK
ncbi:HD-GYP domain-containing protein [Sediminispirochaeta bajacaliforniensis]|uniref:HD-GYP domain-containing protein n=1 Tax=Sediminispirochaeta bajacaliforniensis TaxID=148 RepID=UPI000367A57B|nr:HD-GYP domain-containing protein [Sediminispirochaeta bajacaliforniensis]